MFYALDSKTINWWYWSLALPFIPLYFYIRFIRPSQFSMESYKMFSFVNKWNYFDRIINDQQTNKCANEWTKVKNDWDASFVHIDEKKTSLSLSISSKKKNILNPRFWSKRFRGRFRYFIDKQRYFLYFILFISYFLLKVSFFVTNLFIQIFKHA